MKQGLSIWMLAVLLGTLGLMVACGDDDEEVAETGTLVFTLNAEDFVRDGFVSEDNWQIDFDHVYINIVGPTAYQAVVTEEDGDVEETDGDGTTEARKLLPADLRAHAGHPHATIEEGTAHAALVGEFFIDGHVGPDPIELGQIADVEIGNYNFMNFNIEKASSESEGLVAEYEGYSVVMIGTAVNNETSDSVSFTIKLTEEMNYISCGPHPEDIGVVEPNGKGEAQATFHFDHIFGDYSEDAPADTDDEEAINYMAVGFGPFAALAQDGVLDVTQEDLKFMDVYDQFLDAVLTLGHSGEAHCSLDE